MTIELNATTIQPFLITLLYGSETYTLGVQDAFRIQAPEMRYLRSLKSCTILNKIRNEVVRKELKIFNFYEKIGEYRKTERQYPANAIHEYGHYIYTLPSHGIKKKSKRD